MKKYNITLTIEYEIEADSKNEALERIDEIVGDHIASGERVFNLGEYTIEEID